MNEREAIDWILAHDPLCGGGWDLTEGSVGEWHCQDCGAGRPEDCPRLPQDASNRDSKQVIDIVVRLRQAYGLSNCAPSILVEAADEIERLRRTIPEVGEMFEQLAQMCDEIGSQDYPKKDSTHGERLAWCHGAVACADAIRDRARSNMNSCKG